jgi:pimeloyl-ACP methyl ester carboxylesterase
MADLASVAFLSVKGAVIPDAGHWIMEEQPAALIAAVRPFIGS